MTNLELLREFVRETIGGSQPDESYSLELLNDPSFEEKSMLVPDDVKDKIRKWAKDMKMST